MLDWSAKLFDITVSALPKGVVSLCPPDLKRQWSDSARTLLFADIPTNHDLKRAVRLAWVEATREVLDHALERGAHAEPRFRDRLTRFRGAIDEDLEHIRKTALRRGSGKTLPPSPIDVHIADVVNGVPRFLHDGEVTAAEAAVTDGFLGVLSALSGWDVSELPPELRRLARDGLVRGGGEPRTFGHLMFDAFAEIIKTPNRYPEAAESFEIVQAEVIRDLCERIFDAVQRQPSEFAEAVGALDREQMVRVALGEHVAALDRIERSIDDGFGRMDVRFDVLDAKVDDLGGLKLSAAAERLAEEVRAHINGSIPIASHGAVFVYAANGDRAWLGALADHIAQAVKGHGAGATLEVRPFNLDLARHLLACTRDGTFPFAGALESAAHAATIVRVGRDLDAAVEPDLELMRALRDADLVARTGGAGVRPGDWPAGAVDRLEAAEAGQFPLTLATLPALETLACGKPLCLCLDGAPRDPAVAAFVAFARDRGAQVADLADARDSMRWVDAFLGLVLAGDGDDVSNPYRFLDYYDFEDSAVFYGRDGDARTVLDLIDGLSDAGVAPAVAITGESGCGKSSFLRAKIASALKARDTPVVVVRPTDFHDRAGRPHAVLAGLLRQIAGQGGIALGDGLIASVETLAGTARVATAFNGLRGALAARGPGAARPFLCLDQFEEIVDDLADSGAESEWAGLVDLVDRLLESGLAGLVFTLETSRLGRFRDRLAGGRPIGRARLHEIDAAGDAFLDAIIREPFQRAGYTLDAALVDTLKAAYRDTRAPADGDHASPGSTLPLLALKLSHLFRDVAYRFGHPSADGNDPRSAFSSAREPRTIALDDLPGFDFALDSEIATLADRAWTRSGASDDDLDPFLKPLIRISLDAGEAQADPGASKAGTSKAGMSKIVLASVPRRLGDTYVRIDRAFLRNKLLMPTAGGLRLVHEAVIRRWPRARTWFAETERLLRAEARLREAALAWHRAGRDPADLPADAESVGAAAGLLGAMISLWASDSLLDLSEADSAFRAYCLAVFARSETPEALIETSRKGYRHVHVAAAYGLTDVLARFVEISPDCVHARAEANQRTPLHQAAFDQLETVRFLLDVDADPYALGQDRYLPLDASLVLGRNDILDVLLAVTDPARLGDAQVNPGILAALHGNTAAIDKLTARGFDLSRPHPDGWSPLLAAAFGGREAIVERFLPSADPTATTDGGWTALHLAASRGHVGVVGLCLGDPRQLALVDAPKDDGFTPLMLAAANRHAAVVDLLIHVCDPTLQMQGEGAHAGYTALHWALEPLRNAGRRIDGRLAADVAAVVRALLQSDRIDVNVVGGGRTPLEMAEPLPEARDLILGHPGFRVAAPDDKGETALIRAAKARDRTAVERLLALPEADPDHVAKDGKTAASHMIAGGMIDLVLGLIEAGRVDPWREARGFRGLLAPAIAADDGEALVDRILRVAPAAPPPAHLSAALTRAVVHGRPTAWIDRLVALGAEVSDSLLFDAARHGRLDQFRALTNRRVRKDVRDKWGRTPADLLPETVGSPAVATGGREAAAIPPFHPSAPGWTEVSDPERIEAVRAALDLSGTPEGRLTMRERTLPFYPGARLLIVRHDRWTPKHALVYFLERDGALHRLNGTSPPIHAFNKTALRLDDAIVLDYLEFFCFFVRGEEGAFLNIRSRTNPYLPTSLRDRDASPESFEAFQRVYRPARLHGRSEEGHWRVSALVMYSNAVFLADFLVEPTGMCRMDEDQPVMADLPHKISAPLTYT